jgi:RecA-family ATPase
MTTPSVTTAPGYPRRLDLAEIAGREPPMREWLVEGMIPRSCNVLLSAHGGAGKTLLALQLAVCIAAGKPFLGQPTTQATVVCLFAEDDADELHRRLVSVFDVVGVTMESVADRLLIFDAVGLDVALFSRRVAGDGGQQITMAEPDTTALFDWARFVCAENSAEVLILDSVSDCFDGEENRRAQVRRYLQRCLDLVLKRRGAVVHLAHLDKAAARGGATNGNTYSGSTAWHNSCRSRIALRSIRPDEEGGDDDGRRELVVEKLNYGRPGLAIPLRFEPVRHAFVRDGDSDVGIVGDIRKRTECRAILRGLLEVEAAGRSVMRSKQAHDNAATMLGHLPGFPAALRSGAGRKRLFDHLYKLEADGMVMAETFKTPSKHAVDRWRVTDAGRAEASGGG